MAESVFFSAVRALRRLNLRRKVVVFPTQTICQMRAFGHKKREPEDEFPFISYILPLSAAKHQQDVDIAWRYARNTACLTNRLRINTGQFLSSLGTE